MKVICDRAAMYDALSAATSVIPTRTTKPILECVRITADKNELTLTSYDQEIGLRYHMKEIEVSKTGETLVPGERFTSIVRESADETLALELQGDTCHVRGSDSHFQVFGQDPRQFPPVPDLEGDADIRVPAAQLKQAIDRTLFAAAKESTRYAINGVLWEKRGKKLHLVATDGRRLARASVSLEKSVGADNEVIVPTKAMGILNKLHLAADEAVDIKMMPNQVIMRFARATVSSVLMEGRFPKYEEVIPRDCDKKVEIVTAEFLSAVRRAALLTNEESKGVRISFSKEGIIFSSRAPQQGEATIRLGAKYDGPTVDMGFNPVFLVDALRVCGDSVQFEFKEPNRPGILRSDQDFLYVVMPVNLS